MKNNNEISINIKPVYRVFNQCALEYKPHRDYVTTVHGNNLEIDNNLWFLWHGNYLITSGFVRDLHARKNVLHHDSIGSWSYIELDYTPVSYF